MRKNQEYCMLCSVLEGYNGTIFAYGQVSVVTLQIVYNRKLTLLF